MTVIGGIEVRSMALELDVHAEASPAQNTWYTVTDYSGPGILHFVGFSEGGTNIEECEFKFTVDGNVCTDDIDWLEAAARMVGGPYTSGAVQTYAACMGMGLEFQTGLKIEFRSTNASPGAMKGYSAYNILSKEIERRIIPAGEALPDRDYTYPCEVMAVFIRSLGDLIASKIEFRSSPRVEISIAADGTVTGRLKQHGWGPVGIAGKDYDLSLPRKVWTDLDDDRDVEVELTGLEGYPGKQIFKVPIIGGAMDNSHLPKAQVKTVVDATKVVVG